MNVITRGIRNAFRNATRTVSIVIILGLSIGLALTMLIARQAVGQKIDSVKSSVGNTITIAPAGFSNFSQANNALTTSQLAPINSLAHVSSVTETLTDRLTTIGSSQPSFGFGGQSQSTSSNNQTSLTSPVTIKPGNGGGSGGGYHVFVSGGGSLPANFSPPISIIGTTNPQQLDQADGNVASLASGQYIDGSADTDNAMISSSMASKNNLKVGSTFTAYGTTLTVTGIFTGSTQAVDNDVVVSLPAEQRLSGQAGDVTAAVVTVDSISNVSSVTSAIKAKLGSAVDVTSSQDNAQTTIDSLNGIRNVSLFSLIGAVIAGSVIILLTMIMIVRERRREIGVLKAIGTSNLRVIFQFLVEAVTLTLLGAVIGLAVGVIGGNPVTNVLVSNAGNGSTTTTSAPTTAGGGFRAGGGVRNFGGDNFRSLGNNLAVNNLRNIHAVVGWSILIYGLAAALLIAIIGSVIAASLIAKVRPAEVLRAE